MKQEHFEDLAVDPLRMNGTDLAEHFGRRIQQTLAEVESSEPWRVCTALDTPISLVRDILKEVYLEIVMYQPDSVAAALHAIGQMPRSTPVAWIEEMLHHQAEEFDHNEMALRDYVGFGGNEVFARSRRTSPSSFAIAAVWNYIAAKRDPFVYLGAVYLFEALTPIVTEKVRHLFQARGLSAKGLGFIEHHATADLEHAQQVAQLIADVANRFPESRESMCYGYEYFHHVYPLPAWSAAYRRAINSHSVSAIAAE